MPLTAKAAIRKDMASANSRMEHRHFATIAAIIRDMGEGRTAATLHFANELARTNDRFDRARFLRACGVVVRED